MKSYLSGLTDAQREAVLHVDGPLLILAGPGSGKTRVITHRIANLLDKGATDHQIVALTFTNKAADEMRNRVEALVPRHRVWLGTFHRFCATLLRKYAPLVGLQDNFTIYDTDDAGKILREALDAQKVELFHQSPDSVASAISWAKNNLVGPAAYQSRTGNSLGVAVERVYPEYQARLLKANAVDFDDLLLHVANLLRENPERRAELDERFRYILVDEYQDTNLAQYGIVRALSVDHPNLAVTGDPDQSIYGWRGASLRNILEFEKDFPSVRVVRLEQNYRSTPSILRVADRLIRCNVRRKSKELFTENNDGAPVRLSGYSTQREEASRISDTIATAVTSNKRHFRDFAIFYRINALSRPFELALRERGIPYQMVRGLEFFQRKEIKDVLAYLRLIANPRDDAAVMRVVNVPARGIGKKTLELISAHAARRGICLLDAVREVERIEGLQKSAAGRVLKFAAIIDRISASAAAQVEELMGLVLNESGYQKALVEDGSEESQDRLANIQELLTVAREFDEQHAGHAALESFLDEASLVSDVDAWDSDTDRVTLMTLHASKGLEFPVVFLTAIEEGILPHERSRDRPDQLEEERRLMFVGITRAEEELHLSYVKHRDFRGQRKTAIPSQFLMELPRGEMQVEEMAAEPPFWSAEFEADVHQDEIAWEPSQTPATTAAIASKPFGLMTAAQLANGGTADSPSPDDFAQGMLVLHPEYGLGRIVALSGAGHSRKATVDFSSSAGRRKFILAQCPLRPVIAKT